MSQPKPSRSQSVDKTGVWTPEESGPEERDLTGMTLGDFQVERLLGSGGMGTVYLARQISLNRPVALKVLKSDLLTKPIYLNRFEAEAAAVAKLNHPNIVHVYMLGCIEGVRFIAMEYVQGTNLRDYIIKKGALELPLALSIMRQAGVAIGAAGERGLIHRDIKPENLLLTRKGQVKIADFGLCRDQDPERQHLTQPGVTMGTPLYMSPEQAQGHALDHRSDLYSLGITFYHMLAGIPPFRGDTALAIALKHVKDEPVNLAVHRPDLPPDVVGVVMKLMAKAPDDRYQSAAEMLADLAKIREALHAPSVLVPVPEGAATVAAGSKVLRLPRLSAPLGLPWRLPSVRLGGPVLAGAALLGLALGAAWGGLARPGDLLAETAPASASQPALWMAPAWPAIARRNSPAEQYRSAQLRASWDDRAAAWLAVPGHFPTVREWTTKAYIQLARHLLRIRDAERLQVLAAEIAQWDGTQTHEKQLVVLIQAAVKALNGSVEGVIEEFDKNLNFRSMIDPALLELALEVTTRAARAASPADDAPVPSGLLDIQRRLIAKLLFPGVSGALQGLVNPT